MKKPSNMQMRAISHIRGPALVVAGPGSGKTFVIVSRIHALISSQNVSPDRILVLTFSKAAANEMKERFENTYAIRGVNFGTFHAASYGFLKEFGRTGKYKIINESEKKRILGNIIKNQGIGKDIDDEMILMFLDHISKSKNCPDEDNILPYLDGLSGNKELVDKVIDEYQRFIKDERMIDFDDMILECLNMFKSDKAIKDKAASRFEHIIIDEFQDINKLQYELISILSEKNGNVFAVGDDDQSIYGFRGASYGIMKTFVNDNPGLIRYDLYENHRSGKKIIEFATSVIIHNKNRFKKEFVPVKEGGSVEHKNLRTHKEEEDELVRMIKNLGPYELNDTAVILRNNRDVLLFSSLLYKNGINVKQPVNQNFRVNKREGSVSDDIRSLLDFVYKGQKRSDFIRFMNKPQRYIQRDALNDDRIDFKHLKEYYRNNHDMLSMLDDMEKTLGLCKRLGPSATIDIFVKKLGYGKYLKDQCINEEEYTGLCGFIEKIKDNIQSNTGDIDMSVIIENTSKEKPVKKDDINGVSVITMHASKGLEFKNVFLPDVNEGIIPAKNCTGRELEEECRLLYVALTRAKDRLILLSTEERNRDISRFIKKQVARL